MGVSRERVELGQLVDLHDDLLLQPRGGVRVEVRIASFVGAEAALSYTSCWNANEGLLPTIASEGMCNKSGSPLT